MTQKQRQAAKPASPPNVNEDSDIRDDTEQEAVAVIEALAERMEAAGRKAAETAKGKPRYRDRYAGPLIQDAYSRCAAMVRDLIGPEDAEPGPEQEQ